MKIATWNVNSLNVRLPHVLSWLEESNTDILAIQELKIVSDKFPFEDFQKLGYHSVANCQKTYNGVAFVSKFSLENVEYDLINYDDVQKRVIRATVNGIRIINVYCVNGESLESDKFIYKRKWFEALKQTLKQELKQYNQLILLGDFNIAPRDIDVYDPVKFHERILCSTEERQWFNDLLNMGLVDAFSTLYPEQVSYTWWDYRMNGFKRNLGLRIDHILVTKSLINRVVDVNVDQEPRKWERPSDHTPISVIAM